jgi:(S)-citramalyl-CoA lyase
LNPDRSWLFTPATRPERFPKAAAAGADVQIVDLEDSVAPADKSRARETAMDFLAAPPPGVTYALRLNCLASRVGLEDWLAFLRSPAAPTYLVVPKADSSGQLLVLDRLLSEAKKPTRIVAQVESAKGLAHCESIAVSCPRLAGLMFGTADMAADLGADHSWQALQYARSRMVAAAALGGLLAVDAPYFQISNVNGLKSETVLAVASGFTGKCAIHPSQVATINAAWTPTAEDIKQANAVLLENEKGAGVVDGVMVDEAVARRARRILARHSVSDGGDDHGNRPALPEHKTDGCG